MGKTSNKSKTLPNVHMTKKNFFNLSAGQVTVDGELQISENPVALLDQATNEWSIELRCGAFASPANPSLDVQWVVS